MQSWNLSAFCSAQYDYCAVFQSIINSIEMYITFLLCSILHYLSPFPCLNTVYHHPLSTFRCLDHHCYSVTPITPKSSRSVDLDSWESLYLPAPWQFALWLRAPNDLFHCTPHPETISNIQPVRSKAAGTCCRGWEFCHVRMHLCSSGGW